MDIIHYKHRFLYPIFSYSIIYVLLFEFYSVVLVVVAVVVVGLVSALVFDDPPGAPSRASSHASIHSQYTSTGSDKSIYYNKKVV